MPIIGTTLQVRVESFLFLVKVRICPTLIKRLNPDEAIKQPCKIPRYPVILYADNERLPKVSYII